MYSAIIGLSRITADVATNNWRGEPLLPGATPSRGEAAVTSVTQSSYRGYIWSQHAGTLDILCLLSCEIIQWWISKECSKYTIFCNLIDLSPQFWNNEKNQKCEMRADPSPSSEVWVQFLYKIQNMLIWVVRLRRQKWVFLTNIAWARSIQTRDSDDIIFTTSAVT